MATPHEPTAMDHARALLPELEASGLSVAAFARERGIAPWALYKVSRDHRKTKQAGALTELRVVPDPTPTRALPSEPDPIELVLRSGMTLRVRSGFDEVALRRLLGVLASC